MTGKKVVHRRDPLAFAVDYEAGRINDGETLVSGFQTLIDTGLAWRLGVPFRIMARALIAGGYCYPTTTPEARP